MRRFATFFAACLAGISSPIAFADPLSNRAAGASVKCTLAGPAATALAYEQSNYVNGPVAQDPFYTTLPKQASSAKAGTLLKLEAQSNASIFTLPPTVSLSRFIYQSVDSAGALVPVSAYILWPYAPKAGNPVVAWAHGTSGLAPDCAPSHLRNLWQHFLAPYALVTQGYIVVATDYAGLGVPNNIHGQPVIHQYLNGVSNANDVIYSVQAAQSAFPQLSKEFVVIGHSQGGGAAWAVAQRQAKTPVDGYLGAVAMSPVTNVLNDGPVAPILAAAIAPGLQAINSKFHTTDILSADGQAAVDQLSACGGCMAVIDYTLLTINPTQSNWQNNSNLQSYQKTIENGGKKIDGPLLIGHGQADPLLNINLTIAAVNKTVAAYPASQIEFYQLPDVEHVPSLQAMQPIWLDWIADRFAHVPVGSYNGTSTLSHARPADSLSLSLNWYIALATELYETP
jgi:pimeloyl-ACP methyl ester carboxylesterase